MEKENLKKEIAKYVGLLPEELRQRLYTLILHARYVSMQDGITAAAKTAHGVSVHETDEFTAYLIEKESEAAQWLPPNPQNNKEST